MEQRTHWKKKTAGEACLKLNHCSICGQPEEEDAGARVLLRKRNVLPKDEYRSIFIRSPLYHSHPPMLHSAVPSLQTQPFIIQAYGFS
ncbi:hypothetical protein SLA2020_420880 [Shorea laevis]